MKSFISAVLLLSSMAVSAETISVNLPESGRYIITLENPSSCMSAQYTIIPGHFGWSASGTTLLKATVAEIVETRGRAQWCDQNLNVATGVFVVQGTMEVEINLDGSNGGISSPVIKIENISIK